MATNNSGNQEFINNADGYNLAGGTTKRGLTLTGGNVNITGNNLGAVTYFQSLTNFPYITYQDVNGLTAISNIASDYATTTTAGGNSTLTIASKRYQYFTGTQTQNVILPDATTVAIGHTYVIKNLSTNAITVKTSDGTNIAILYNDTEYEFKCTDVTTTVGVWEKTNSTNQLDLESTESSFGARNVTYWSPVGNASTTVTAYGIAALTTLGTATTTNTAIATGSVRLRAKRLEYLVTVAATTAIASFRSPVLIWTTGGASVNQGGFLMRCRWGNATGGTVTTNRCFVGMSGTAAATAPTDVQPSTLQQMFGVGWDSADTNIQFMYNAAVATASKIDLGANFPVPVTDRSAPYDLILYSPHTASQIVYYYLRNLDTNAIARGSVTTNLPSATTLLGPRAYISVGGTSSVVGITLFNLYLETEY